MIINDTYLKKHSPIPLNFDTSEILPMVNLTESIWVRPLLGVDLYDEICTQVADDDLSDTNSTLLTDGGLWQMLGVAVCYENLPQIVYHVSEVGLTKGSSENSTSIDLKELTYYASHLRAQLESLKGYTVKWLSEHSDSFPLWEPDWEGCGCTPPVTSCCGTNATLQKPEPMRILYTTPKKNLDIR